MNVYKVNFDNNNATSAQVFHQRFDHDTEYYYQYMGQIIYAMVKAEDEQKAREAAQKLITSANHRNNDINNRFSAAA